MIDNGYPNYVVNSTTDRKLRNFNGLSEFGPNKCPVYLHLPWHGAVSAKFEKQIVSAVRQSYFAVEPRVVVTTCQLLPATKKYVLPASQNSNVIY